MDFLKIRQTFLSCGRVLRWPLIFEETELRLVLIVFLAVFAFFSSQDVMAQPAPAVPATCDQEFLDVMETRAWMEGKREMEIAQRLILKPDSVLEYSCFNARATQLNNADLFSSPENDFSLRILVNAALSDYLEDNFNHDYGGGTVEGGGGCSVMNHVWNTLRCQNFDDELFLTFADLVSTDPRNEPVPCEASARSEIWQAALAVVAPVPAIPPNNGGVESVTTFFPQLNPNCGASVAIPTGVIVTRFSGTDTFEEYVCTAPGCTYNGTSCN
jgi:hypothetical protein